MVNVETGRKCAMRMQESCATLLDRMMHSAGFAASRRLWVASIAVLMFFAAGAVSTGDTRAQVSSRPKLPAPEMQRLAKFYVGTWDYTETYPPSASHPNGLQNTGVYSSELGPGGNSIINKFHSKGPAGDFEGWLVMTWDAKEKGYKAYAFGNDFPGAIVETGQWEGETLVFRGEFSAGAMKVAVHNSTRVVASGKMLSDEFSSANGAPEKLLVHVEATKRPLPDHGENVDENSFPGEPPDDFFAGNYSIIGQRPASGAAYKGHAHIEVKDRKIRLSRTINGTTTAVDGKFVPGGESKKKCLQFAWKDSQGSAEMLCQYSVDFDNYARLSCVSSYGKGRLPGFESYYPVLK